jgi:hypothetical protein
MKAGYSFCALKDIDLRTISFRFLCLFHGIFGAFLYCFSKLGMIPIAQLIPEMRFLSRTINFFWLCHWTGIRVGNVPVVFSIHPIQNMYLPLFGPRP